MRKKEPKPLGVADGFSFDNSSSNEGQIIESTTVEPIVQQPSGTASTTAIPQRKYSKYYTPNPKIGAKGGVLGRGPVEESERKVQFSVTCTPAQKEIYQKAALADGRKLPDFINKAIQEYIENHKL